MHFIFAFARYHLHACWCVMQYLWQIILIWTLCRINFPLSLQRMKRKKEEEPLVRQLFTVFLISMNSLLEKKVLENFNFLHKSKDNEFGMRKYNPPPFRAKMSPRQNRLLNRTATTSRRMVLKTTREMSALPASKAKRLPSPRAGQTNATTWTKTTLRLRMVASLKSL